MREDSCSIEAETAKKPRADRREWTTPRMEIVDVADITEGGLVSSLLDRLGFAS